MVRERISLGNENRRNLGFVNTTNDTLFLFSLPKGYAIVEFEWKKSAAKVLDRLKDEMFCLGRLPKPVFAKPFITRYTNKYS